jgi:isoleucyl-tRNA synthetase
MVDYREDMPISEEMFTRLGEAYRKIRNTARYLLSNLDDFDPETHSVAEDALEELDRWALDNHRRVVERLRRAYDRYEFHLVYHQLVQYCASDLSALYLDVLKDRLYCDATAGDRRRSAQTALHRIASDITRLMAPVLPFTAEEIWERLPGSGGDSVHLALFPEVEPGDAKRLERWDDLLEARQAVTRKLEEARAAKTLSSSLGARVTLRASGPLLEQLRGYEATSRYWPGELANLMIVSRVELLEGEGELQVEVSAASGSKCERCWSVSEEVGSQSVHVGVCPRCARVLEQL